ncbi:esterase-like activity of phytase family protein [Rhizobium sp. RCAM05350]|nr:esterase-like activity of phytase family protein [Rhizobium sp. RCAM05350]
MKTILKLAAGLAAFLAATSAFAQNPAIGKASLLGQIVLPTGLKIGGVEFGGISRLDYDAASDLFYAISDDRSQKAPARFYTLKLAIVENGVQGIDIVSTTQLSDMAGKPFAEKDIDPEAIRYDAANKKLYWSSEGDAKGRPAVYEAGLDGKAVRSFELPDYYLPNADGSQGVRSNLAFEGLTMSADGKTLWVGTENALAQDGDKATLEVGSRSRLIGFDVATGATVSEFAYDTGPIFVKATKAPYYNDNGLSDMLALDGNSVLTVERSFALRDRHGDQFLYYEFCWRDRRERSEFTEEC